MVVGVVLVRFELVVAAGGREALLGKPVALAPLPGQGLGEVSAAAQAYGVRAGMGLGEALGRCPGLVLVPADPAGVAEAWERILVGLESIGAAVESECPGVACFEARGLEGLYGSSVEGVIAAARRALGVPARVGVGPSRFCALAGAARARGRRAVIVAGGEAGARAYLARLPVGLLRAREETAELPEVLERLGISTLGELAGLSRAAVADRFGAAGLVANDLAQGRDTALVAREPAQRLLETLELDEAASGMALEGALDLLVDRLLARRERHRRTLRAAVLTARLVEGGSWRERIVFREALADPVRMRLVLRPRLSLLPAPAQTLGLIAEGLSAPVGDQRALLEEAGELRAQRLHEAVCQARAAAGPDAALRVLMVDPGSRVPERRAVLAPFQ